MKYLIITTLALILTVTIAKAVSEMSASVEYTPENCVTTCTSQCEAGVIEFGKD